MNMRSLVISSTAAAAIMLALPAFAADVTLTQHCEDLAKEFAAANVSHVAPKKLEEAKEQANHGEKMCKTDPKAGVKALDLAFKDIGVTPK